jgi:anti-sigma B factor antagonist
MDDRPGTRVDRPFTMGVERDSSGTTFVVVEGDVDLHSASPLRDQLAEARAGGASRIVVDLSGATFLDSMGLGVLLAAKRDLAGGDGTLELVVTRDDIRRIFEITMLERVFVIHGSRAETGRAGRGR